MLAYVAVMGACSGVAFWAGCGSDESSDAGSSGGTGDGGASSSSSGSSGTAPGGDGGVDPPDAAPGGDTTKISCGTTACPLPAQACCIYDVRGGDRAFSCAAVSPEAGCPQPEGGAGGDVVSLRCSGSANCPSGQVCCVRDRNGNASSECKASCGNNEAQLCDPSKGDAGGCPANDPCSSRNIDDWGNLPNTYGTCGGRGN